MKILGDFLKQAIYQIKTVMGVSDRSYSHIRESGVFETRQDNIMSISSWLMKVSCLIDAHMKHSHGAKYSNHTGSLWDIIIRILGFFDDNNLYNTGEKYETIKDILKKTQDDAQFWHNLITSSGARLELAKCFTQIIQFEFALSGAPVISVSEEGLNFTLIERILDFEFPIDPISAYST